MSTAEQHSRFRAMGQVANELRVNRITGRTRNIFAEMARNHAGLTQAELASMLDVSRQYVSHIENGRAPLKEDLAERWAEACGVPDEALVEDLNHFWR